MTVEENIKKLIDATKEGKISWERKTQTVYIWRRQASDGSNINVVVQKKSTNGEPDLLFRLWNLDEKKSILDIEYNLSNEGLKELLKELYQSITGNNLHVSDIFSDILKGL